MACTLSPPQCAAWHKALLPYAAGDFTATDSDCVRLGHVVWPCGPCGLRAQGSGKTYTLSGVPGSQTKDSGLMPFTVRHLFQLVNTHRTLVRARSCRCRRRRQGGARGPHFVRRRGRVNEGV